MTSSVGRDRLSRISTMWSLIIAAHGDDPQSVAVAQSRLVERYSGAVYRYLLKVLGETNAADDVFQEFVLNIIRGRFRQADPRRGRFRDYLKTSVVRLAREFQRKRSRCRETSTAANIVESVGDDPEFLDAQFMQSCREEFLARTWQALKSEENQTGRPVFTVLDARTREPNLTSEQLAHRLMQQECSPSVGNAAAVRKLLERSRKRFAQLLLDEVSQTLELPTRENLESELIAMGLLPYCRVALSERFPSSPASE